MDPRLIIILAAGFVALAGYVCIAPDQFGFLRLPQAFLQLGMERTVTGLALMLLGFLVALSEAETEDKQKRARRAQPFAFGEAELVPAEGQLRLEPEPAPEAKLVANTAPELPAAESEIQVAPEPAPASEPEPAPEAPTAKRRPDLYEAIEEDAAAVPKSDTPPPMEP